MKKIVILGIGVGAELVARWVVGAAAFPVVGGFVEGVYEFLLCGV